MKMAREMTSMSVKSENGKVRASWDKTNEVYRFYSTLTNKAIPGSQIVKATGVKAVSSIQSVRWAKRAANALS